MDYEQKLIDAVINAGVYGTEIYQRRLKANSTDKDVRDDLMSEGYASLMFAEAGFDVELRERPDIALSLRGHRLFAEVKRFRRKRQDDIDQSECEADSSDMAIPCQPRGLPRGIKS